MIFLYDSATGDAVAKFEDEAIYLPVADEATARQIVETRNLTLAKVVKDNWYLVTSKKEVAFIYADGPIRMRHAIEIKIRDAQVRAYAVKIELPSVPQLEMQICVPGDGLFVNGRALAEIGQVAHLYPVSGPVELKPPTKYTPVPYPPMPPQA